MQLPSPPPGAQPIAHSARFLIEAPVGGLLGALVAAFVRTEYPTAILRSIDSSSPDVVTVSAEDRPSKMIVFPAHPDPATIARLACGGIHSLVSLGSSLNDLRDAMNRMLSGGSPFLSVELVQILATASLRSAPQPQRAALTHREDEILRLLQLGLSNQEMADRLSVSTNTVRAHLQAISAKFGVSGRTRVIAHSRELAENPTR